MSTETLSSTAHDARREDPGMRIRKDALMKQWHRYRKVFEATKFDSKGLEETAKWLEDTDFEADPRTEKGISTREEFFRSEFAQVIMQHGVRVYEEFKKQLNEASPYISKKSKERWMERFYEQGKVTFMAKKYFIERQFPSYLKAWKKAEEDRKNLLAHPQFGALIKERSEFAIMSETQRETFLELHYDERVDMLNRCTAALMAREKNQGMLYERAEKMLEAAVTKGVMSTNKIGSWMKRIFDGKHTNEEIKAFLQGEGKDPLPVLIDRWRDVRKDYDSLMQKAKERGEDKSPRGFKFLTPEAFLQLSYDERKAHVRELKERLNDVKNVANEKPIFVKIRHAMDMKDGNEALLLIAEAKADPGTTFTEKERLVSMEAYARKFAVSIETESLTNAMETKIRMDRIIRSLEHTHPQIAPMIYRLMQGPQANRSLHQLRWTVYNNVWCRGRGYLTDAIAEEGAQEEYMHMTKERALQGKDIGRHDHISEQTAGDQYIRKNEMANHKATYRHVDISSQYAMHKTAEWFEREQEARVLYWTTMCFHDDGMAKGEGWHRDLLMALTELRGLSRSLDTSGFVYQGRHQGLRKRGDAWKMSA